MGNIVGASSAWTITYEKVREIAPAAMARFEGYLAEFEKRRSLLSDLAADEAPESADGIDWDVYDGPPLLWRFYWDDEVPDEAREIFGELRAAVLAAEGIEISVMDYDEEGDLAAGGADIDWPCFVVDNAKDWTPAGKRAYNAGLIRHAIWVEAEY